MIFLSLFNGISCGRVAAERANIPVDKYYSSEIEPNAIKISHKNYPDTTEVGDVRLLSAEDFKDVDIIIGGSPCQNFSFAGTMKGASTKDKIEVTSLEQYLRLKEQKFEFEGYSYLVWEFVRLVKEINPKYFLLENVKMAKKWEKVITDALNVEPILINSALVSAQDRVRLYWTNIPNVKQPSDKHIYIDDILQTDIEHKYLPKTRLDYTNYDKSKVDKSIFKNTATHIGASRKWGNSVRSNGKAFTLRRVNPGGIIDENYNIRYFTPIEAERLQTLPDNYTFIEGIKDSDRYSVLGNGWNVDTVAHILKGLNEVTDNE